MSFQSYVLQRLTAISDSLNLINTKAKSIDVLPVQSTLDPSSKIHVSRNGESESLQVQKIIDSVLVGSYNRLLSIETITLAGNVVTIPALAQWVIDNVNYSNPAVINITVPYCTTGLSRKDILVANTLNDIVLVKGPETAGITIQPNLPPNTVYVTEMDVTDSTVGQPQPPEVNGAYVQKSEQYPIPVTGGGGGTFSVDSEKGYFEISNYSTHIVNIEDQQGYIYLGREICFRNTGTQDLTFQHNAIASEMNKKYFTFPGEENFILKPRELLTLKLGSNGRLNYMGASDPRKMDKAIYDTTNSGIVDGAEGLVRIVFAQEAIAKGDPVYVSNTGDPTFVMRARADNNAKMPAFAIAQEAIAIGAIGKVTINGSIRGLNTGSLDLGKNIYVGPTGGITSTKPTTNAQIIGVSIETDASDGVIVIDPQPIAEFYGGIKIWNVKDYGALGNGTTDDTLAVQNTINACNNAGGGIVYFPNGIYYINGSLDSDSQSQIYFPLNSFSSSINLKTIKLLGETPPNKYSNPFNSTGSNDHPDTGVIIKSNLLSIGNVIGSRSESVSWGNFNFIHVEIENISIRVRSMTSTTNVTPVATALNMGNVAMFDGNNIEVCNTSKMAFQLEPSSTNYGIIMPKNNNFAFSNLSNFLAFGCYIAVDCYEHTHLDKFLIDTCVIGLNINAVNHSIHVTKGIIARSRYNIRAETGSYFYVNHVSFEDDYLKSVTTPTWNATIYDLFDVNGTANGLIRFHTVRANFGADYSITKRNLVNTKVKFVKINEFTEFIFTSDIIPPTTNNLLAYWKFNEVSGNYLDLSGNSRTATRVNGATSGAGKIGNAMLLANASAQYANAGQTGLSYANSAFTICGWFKINVTAQAFQTLITKGDSVAREYNIYYTKAGNVLSFAFYNGTTLRGQINKTIQTGVWIFICAELIGNTMKLSINNDAPTSTTATAVSGAIAKDLLIGNTDTAGSSLDGGVDELSIWNRELNSNEKGYLYNSGLGNSII